MSKWDVTFGKKHWERMTKNSAKAVKEANNVFLTEMWNSAMVLKDDLEAGFDEYITEAKHYDLDDAQADIYNRHSQSYHQYTRDLVGDDGTFNALRGTNTAVVGYATYSKSTGIIKVGVTGPDVLYMEYGTGDIGEATEDSEARSAATDIDLQPYNSGQTIREEDGYKYWTYHSSVHFGMPTGAVVYHTFEDHNKKLMDTTKITMTTYLQSIFSGKDTK